MVNLMQFGQAYQTYNIGGSGGPVSMRVLARNVLEACASGKQLHFEEGVFGGDKHRKIDAEKLRFTCPFNIPTMPLSQGLEETVAWYRNNLL
jgi:nucleoside-diphosphate-sugar epimerase